MVGNTVESLCLGDAGASVSEGAALGLLLRKGGGFVHLMRLGFLGTGDWIFSTMVKRSEVDGGSEVGVVVGRALCARDMRVG